MHEFRNKVDGWFMMSLLLIPIVNTYMWFTSRDVLQTLGLGSWVILAVFAISSVIEMVGLYFKPIETILSCFFLFAGAFFVLMFEAAWSGQVVGTQVTSLLGVFVVIYFLLLTLVQLPNLGSVLVKLDIV